MEVRINDECEVKFRFSHRVLTLEREGDRSQIRRRGTMCFMDAKTPEQGDQQVSASAVCHPNDQFTKSRGRKMSLKRAMSRAGLDKEVNCYDLTVAASRGKHTEPRTLAPSVKMFRAAFKSRSMCNPQKGQS